MGEVLYSAMEFFNLPSEEKRSSCLATCISRRDMERDWGMALTRSSSGEFSWSIMHLHLKTGLVHGPRIHQSIGVPKSQYSGGTLYFVKFLFQKGQWHFRLHISAFIIISDTKQNLPIWVGLVGPAIALKIFWTRGAHKSEHNKLWPSKNGRLRNIGSESRALVVLGSLLLVCSLFITCVNIL